jgi:hypothetical protein
VKNPKHRNDTEVFLFTSTGFEGSRLPKSRADVLVVNRQYPLDITVAVTDRELESAAWPMLVAIKTNRVTKGIRPIFN